ncbi:MAG: DUF86 domain-containing protein [Actinomycetota bacterium]|nr:DUF86 domain-containing protein [Actinomycetota bacterium]
MKRYDDQRLDDIETAIAAIRSHLARGELSDGLVFDAVRIRLLEIGEAVKAISPSLLATEPGIPWKNIATMRDQLAHRYFDTEHAIVSGTITNDIEPLLAAVQRLQAQVAPSK